MARAYLRHGVDAGLDDRLLLQELVQASLLGRARLVKLALPCPDRRLVHGVQVRDALPVPDLQRQRREGHRRAL